jgi:K+/H+ antiporter YhaU regulatory subunit KhtT
VSPRADFTFAAGDNVVMLGDSAALKKVQKL